MKLIIVSLAFLLVATPDLTDWELVKKDEDMEVYLRKPEGQKYEDVRIITVADASVKEILAALEDIPYYSEWGYATKTSEFVRKISKSEFDYYIGISMPFPVKDRDVIIHYKREKDPHTGYTNIQLSSNPDLRKERDGHIRVRQFECSYILKPLKNGSVEIEYTVSADPGGNLPAWVVNLFTTKGPIHTMRGLLELLESGRYG